MHERDVKIMERHGKNHTQNQSHDDQQNSNQSNNDTNTPKKIKKQQQRTSAIALTILIAISFGLIGFEVLNNPESFADKTAIKGSRSLTILAKEKEKSNPGLIADASTHWNTTSDHGEPLKEVNRLQTNKIKALKRQLAESSQKSHEIKAHLFTKGDPADRARLAEVCQELLDKDRRTLEQSEKITELEAERQVRGQKINRMEHTIDALATMTDTQRATKEKAINNLQNQIEQLHSNARIEKEELQNAIGELEENQIELRETLSEKLTAIQNLEDEISWQYGLLEEKDTEIQAQTTLFTTSESQLQKEVQDLTAALELEMLKAKSAESDLEVAFAREQAQKQYSKTIENRLTQTEELTRKEKEDFTENMTTLMGKYLNLQGLLDVYTHSHDHLNTKQQKLSALVREEHSKADKLQQDLEFAIASSESEQQRGLCIEEELHDTAQKVLTMRNELKAQQLVLEAKQQDLDTLSYSNASLRDQLHEKINQLSASLEDTQNESRIKDVVVRDLTINLKLEKTRIQELENKLNIEIAQHQANFAKGIEIEKLLHEKAETLTALEDRLQDKQYEIGELKQQVNTASLNFKEEKSRTNELHTALSTALQENENEHSEITTLKGTIEENTDTLSLMQDRINNKMQVIHDLHARLEEVARDLDSEKGKNTELQFLVTDFSNKRNAEMLRADHLETSLRKHADKAVSIQDGIADKQQEVRQLFDQVEELNSELTLQKKKYANLQDELNAAIGKYENESFRTQSLEESITKNERKIGDLLDQMDHLNLNYENEYSRVKELEGNLYSALSRSETEINHSRVLEKSINSNQSEFFQLKTTIEDQHEEIASLKEQISKMVNHVELEKSRSLAYKKANDKELEQAKEFEQKLDQYTSQIQTLQEQVQEKNKQITEIKNSEDILTIQRKQSSKNDLAYTPFVQELTERIKNKATQNSELEDATTRHTVEDGENLSIISTYYYGTPNRWVDIYNANRKAIPDKNRLDSGISLAIPD